MDKGQQTELLETQDSDKAQKTSSQDESPKERESPVKKAQEATTGIKQPRIPLPDAVMRRIENFNEDLRREAESKGQVKHEDKQSSEQEFSSLYHRARRWTATLDADKKSLYEKSRKNFKLFVILLILFGVYFFYTANFTDNTSLAITALRQQLPLKLDENTALTQVELTSKELRLYVVKRAQAYAYLDAEARSEAIARLRVNALPLCRNEAMHKIIAEGKRILVLLDADDGSFHREMAIEKCPQPE